VLVELRRAGSWVPVLLLTARDAVEDRVRGLDLGADDYLTKPFSFVVLMARLRAMMRRAQRERPVVLTAGDLALDPARRRCGRGGVEIVLTAREFAVLHYLMRCRDEVVSRSEIVAHVWDENFDGDPNIVDVYVGRLRRKIDTPFDRVAIETVRGMGYRLHGTGG
jgi:DNA-binding response OmpR family regulator